MPRQKRPSPSHSSSQTADLLTLEELAESMRISLTSAYELAKADRLPIPAIRVGRQYRFSRPAYEALLARQHDDRKAGPR